VQSADCDGPFLIIDGVRAKRFGAFFATKLGCGDPKTRLECLRRKPPRDVMEPYFKWFCPGGGENDPWCNRSATTGGRVDEGGGTSGNSAGAGWNDNSAIQTPASLTRATTATTNTTNPGINTPKPWPSMLPPMAPVAGFVAVVDGSDQGLPDTPYRMMVQGLINTSPTGEKIQVILGSMTDEMTTFIIGLGIIVPGVVITPPLTEKDVNTVVKHLIKYHDNWNNNTAAALEAAYPTALYSTSLFRMIRIGTHLLFRCGQRNTARVLSAAGVKTFLYSWEFHDSTTYIDPRSQECVDRIGVNCGDYHANEIPYLFDRYKGSNPKGVLMEAVMGGLWTAFAKQGGNPNLVQPIAGVPPFTWPEYDAAGDRHLVLTEAPHHSANMSRAQCDFWASLPPQDGYPV
jgi:carboxylesterase type B